MVIFVDIKEAKEMIMQELENLKDENKTPKIKIKDIYKGNTGMSNVFFKAGKDLDLQNENINMSIKAGFHHIEQTN